MLLANIFLEFYLYTVIPTRQLVLLSTRQLQPHDHAPDEAFLLAGQWHHQGTEPECRLSPRTPQAASGGASCSHTSPGPGLGRALAGLQGLALLKPDRG